MLHYFRSSEMIIFLALLMGALTAFSPDRWLPASVIAWRKGWKTSRTILFASFALFFHVLLGYFLFLVFQDIEHLVDQSFQIHLSSSRLFYLAVAFMFALILARKWRLPRIQKALHVDSHNFWGSLIVFSLLGPCEMIVPIFVKAKALGVGYLLPFVAFLIGSCFAGTSLVTGGKWLWNKPLGLPQGMDWVYRKSFILSLLIGITLSVGFSMI